MNGNAMSALAFGSHPAMQYNNGVSEELSSVGNSRVHGLKYNYSVCNCHI